MMIKLTKNEVEKACSHWLRARGYSTEKKRETDVDVPVAVDKRFGIICTHTRNGADCFVEIEEAKP